MGSGSRSGAASRKIGLWDRRSTATVSRSSPIASVAAVSMNLLRATVGSTEAPEKDFCGSMRFCTLVTLDP